MALHHGGVASAPGVPRRRLRAGLREAQARPRRGSRIGLPTVFSSLLLLGTAGLLTSLGIFLAARYVGPQAPRSLNFPAGLVNPTSAPTPTPPPPTPAPTPGAVVTPMPTQPPGPPARVFVLPTPEPPAGWCEAVLGWSQTLTEHLCPTG